MPWSSWKKIGMVFAAGTAIGVFDGLNALYAHLGNSGTFGIMSYQAGFMAASAAAAYFCLSEPGWSNFRKLSTMLAAPFIATIGDNVSIDVQLKKPYLLWIPQKGWEWRNHVFRQTDLAPLAHLTDGKTFGILDGYLISIAAVSAYVGLQYQLSKRDK